MSKHGESGLFDPMMGDAVEPAFLTPTVFVDEDGDPLDVGPPAPGEGDDLLDRDELEMEC